MYVGLEIQVICPVSGRIVGFTGALQVGTILNVPPYPRVRLQKESGSVSSDFLELIFKRDFDTPSDSTQVVEGDLPVEAGEVLFVRVEAENTAPGPLDSFIFGTISVEEE